MMPSYRKAAIGMETFRGFAVISPTLVSSWQGQFLLSIY
jgi:hypothetical protein